MIKEIVNYVKEKTNKTIIVLTWGFGFVISVISGFCVISIILKISVFSSKYNSYMPSFDFLVFFATLMNAFATFLAVYISFKALEKAKKAYEESITARKSSEFSHLFTQIISNHKDVFEKESLKRTKLNYKRILILDYWYLYRYKNENVFRNFYHFYKFRQHTINCTCDIVNIWNDYNKLITSNVDFSHCFKYVFYEIDTVIKADAFGKEDYYKEDKKRHYINIIQSYTNYDELFCYAINLMQHFHLFPKDKSFLKEIKKYEFFKNLKDDPRYRGILTSLGKKDDVCKDLKELMDVCDLIGRVG